MLLTLTSLCKEGDIRYFYCTVDDIESGLEVLSLVALQGDTVLEAYFTDEHGRLNLPANVFDGQSFRKPIRRLEKQWKRVLDKPIGKGSVHTLEVQACTRRLMATHQAQLDHTNHCIASLTSLQHRAQHMFTSELTRSQLLRHYQGLIDTCHATITRLEQWQLISQASVRRLAK